MKRRGLAIRATTPLSAAERAAATGLPEHDEMPKTRGECVGGPRPCPWVRCRHHLYLEVTERTGALYVNFPHLRPDQLAESCSLDVADRGGASLRLVGRVTGVTIERVRQIEVEGCHGVDLELLKAARLAARFRQRFRTAAHDAAESRGAAK